MFSSNSAKFSVIWESHDCTFKAFFEIQISHRSSDSQAVESCAVFELNTSTVQKIPNNLLHELCVGMRLRLRAFSF